MNETKINQNIKIRGFAGLINSILLPINEKEEFKEKFKKTKLKVLINAPNVNYAPLITIDKGKLSVESYLNKPKHNIDKKIIGWDCYVEMDTILFIKFAMKRLSLIGLIKQILLRKVKIKGSIKLLKIRHLLKLITD